MTPDDLARHIPPEAVEAAETEVSRMAKLGINPAQIARTALAAGLAAWPNLKIDPSWELRTNKRRVDLIIPLPTEAGE